MAMNSIDEILEMISDGEWHTIKEVLSVTYETPLKVLTCINFLAHHDFIQVDRAEGKIKLLPSVKEMLDMLKELGKNGRS